MTTAMKKQMITPLIFKTYAKVVPRLPKPTVCGAFGDAAGYMIIYFAEQKIMTGIKKCGAAN